MLSRLKVRTTTHVNTTGTMNMYLLQRFLCDCEHETKQMHVLKPIHRLDSKENILDSMGFYGIL